MTYPKHFTVEEFECKGVGCCEHSSPMDSYFLKRLGLFRERINKPITITSGFRCNKHNKSIGGATRSYHAIGRACDIKINGIGVDAVAEVAKEYFNGVIIYDSWVHVDVRDRTYFEDKRGKL